MAARHANRNARALANLDALVERARRYAVSGLQAFVRDLQADWDNKSKARVPEGRIDAAEDAVEIVTIHSAKRSRMAGRHSDQFNDRALSRRAIRAPAVRQLLALDAGPDLASARAEEGAEEADQRERIWYVACRRARDLLMLPSIPQVTKSSWFSSINLWQNELDELDLAALPEPITRAASSTKNEQSAEGFAAEQQCIEESAAAIVWHRPSDHDTDRPGDPLESIIVVEAIAEHPDVVGAGTLRGVILHK
jgi:ATP-dependent exoDNAse (exonuclease V) beta subunit